MTTYQATLRRLAIYLAVSIIAFLLSLRDVPALNDDKTADLNLFQALFWWACAIAFVIFLVLALGRLVEVLRLRAALHRKKRTRPIKPQNLAEDRQVEAKYIKK